MTLRAVSETTANELNFNKPPYPENSDLKTGIILYRIHVITSLHNVFINGNADTCLIFADTDLCSHFWTFIIDLWTTNRVRVCPVTYK